MPKITCEICGTIYSDTEHACPICGWEQDGIDFGDELADLNRQENAEQSTAACQPKRQKEIFDYDAVNRSDYEAGDTELMEDAELPEEDDSNRSSPVLIVFLTILIVALLCAIGFIFVRYFLPAQNQTQDTEPVQTVQTEETETTVPTIPCTSISATESIPELTKEGQYRILHVVVTPSDTTDSLCFTSADESVATVTEEGRVVAISEGTTTITVTCGNQSLECPVTVRYAPEETEEKTEEETAPSTDAESVTAEDEESISTEATVETAPQESTEETAATEADVILKLKKTDITFGRSGVSAALELDCDLAVEDAEWTTGNPNVATVKDGNVTAVGPGITSITVKYGNQTATCIVRCNF